MPPTSKAVGRDQPGKCQQHKRCHCSHSMHRGRTWHESNLKIQRRSDILIITENHWNSIWFVDLLIRSHHGCSACEMQTIAAFWEGRIAPETERYVFLLNVLVAFITFSSQNNPFFASEASAERSESSYQTFLHFCFFRVPFSSGMQCVPWNLKRTHRTQFWTQASRIVGTWSTGSKSSKSFFSRPKNGAGLRMQQSFFCKQKGILCWRRNN